MAAEKEHKGVSRPAPEEEDTVPGDAFGEDYGQDAKKQKIDEDKKTSELMQVLKSMMEMQQQQQQQMQQMQQSMMLQMQMLQNFLENVSSRGIGSAASCDPRGPVRA